MKSQKTLGKAARSAKKLHVKANTNMTGFLPILSANTPPAKAPTSHPAKITDVEIVPSKDLSQTKSN